MKNDQALAEMLAELDAELGALNDLWPVARQNPGAASRTAAQAPSSA